MPSNELIEKVARELCNDVGAEYDKHPAYWNKFAEVAASTILAALQEPTEGMREAGIEAIDDNWERGVMRPAANSSLTCWRAMLSASALGEQSE